MDCPKCGQIYPPEQEECCRCGVIFGKIRREEGPLPTVPGDQAGPEDKGLPPAADLLLAAGERRGRSLGIWLLTLFFLTLWGGRLIVAPLAGDGAGESLLHFVNLPFHEAGHLFFSPFGPFVTSLGGTLGQLLIPLLALGTLLLKNRDPFGAALCLWWFDENFLDIAPYINDASIGELPLLGGNTGGTSPYGFHDWEYLLTESGLLSYDHLFARISHLCGALLILLSLIWLSCLLYRESRLRPPTRADATR